MAIVNKFDKNCSTCQKNVFAGEGVAVNYSDEWYTYHNDCVPAEFQGQTVKKDANRPSEITEDGCVFIPFNAAHVELIKTIPNRSWDKQNGCWKFPLTKASIDRAVEIGKILNIKIADSLLAEFIEKPKCKNFDKMFDYQKEGARFLSSRSAALLGDEMGTGKTIQTLCALPLQARVLIVCPSSLKFNWVKEANKWRPDYKVTVLNSSKATSDYEVDIIVGKDKFRLPNPNEIMIMNRELLPEMLVPKKTADKDYPVCALDEDFKSVIGETYLIVDEAQNSTIHELKTIITRIGENSKIVLLGDIEQIDTPYLDSLSNGLTITIEKFKNERIAGHITLTKGERSELATLASRLL